MGNEVLDWDTLYRALYNRFHPDGISEEDIEKLTEYVLSFFGFEDRIIDNILLPSDRDVFHMLEEEGFLKSEMEETTLPKGKIWRVHYWVLRKDAIERMAEEKPEERGEEEESPEELYERLFREMEMNEEEEE